MPLRVRVALACVAGAIVALLAAGSMLGVVLARQQYRDLDRQLEAVARLVTPMLIREAASGRPAGRGANREQMVARIAEVTGASYAAVAVRAGQVVASSSSSDSLPAQELSQVSARPGSSTVRTPEGDLRVQARAAGARSAVTIVVAMPVAGVRSRVATARRAVAVVGALAVPVAGGLGWLLAGPAVRPLRRLRERTALVGRTPPAQRPAWRPGTPEIDQVATALDALDDDLAIARAREAQALEAARGFAASAGHELRTPLTAISTDLSVLRDHPDLPLPERLEVIASLGRAEQRLLATLQALEQLARGDLGAAETSEPLDVTDLVLQVVEDATRRYPGTQVAADVPSSGVRVRGWWPGLWLALDNLVANAVRHGHASRIDVRVLPTAQGCSLVVDDDGPGIPQGDRPRMVNRFVRGRGAVGSGSGLGLALVDQQAQLHGGWLELAQSPTGGLRAVLHLPAQPAPVGGTART